MIQAQERKGRRRRWLILAGSATALVLFGLFVVYGGGELQGVGEFADAGVAPSRRDARVARQRAVIGDSEPTQIYFGDLHVHTTYSADAFMRSLPLMAGEGLHPPADACDFARHCADLDFFALTDHAEAMTPELWTQTREAIRQCNHLAGDASDPDLVAFVGFEWSQVGATPDAHWGHRNVIFRSDRDDAIPARPIAAPGLGGALRSMRSGGTSRAMIPLVPILDFPHRDRYLDLALFLQSANAIEDCPEGVDTRALPPDCREYANDPAALFAKLDEWGHEALVIPHGTTWGFYTPPGYSWDKALEPAQDDPDRQRLIEIYSGHGNSEEYRDHRAVEFADDGSVHCPAPSEGFEPCCHRAGEIIRGRCEGVSDEVCEARVEEARDAYVNAGVAGHLTVPGATLEEWGNCGQCTDCFQPAFNSRPAAAVQYAIARGHFESGTARHQTLGFIASSDNHSARPGTGYKEYARRRMTEATGPRDETWAERIFGEREEATPEPRRFSREELTREPGFRLLHLERQASFFLTGGLVAVHATERTRDALWNSLEAREVYGTSGPRMLLWFHMDNHPSGRRPMGAELPFGGTPSFTVRAAGDFVQQPGCPRDAAEALGERRVDTVCGGECYHPASERHRITRVEVVRIRRQTDEEEEIGALIEDPWLVRECEGTGPLCEVTFDDPEYAAWGRDVVYYVRAIQEPTPQVNAGALRCEGEGCPELDPCHGDYRTSFEDDCLADDEARAWSSPIYLRFDGAIVPEPAIVEDAATEGP